MLLFAVGARRDCEKLLGKMRLYSAGTLEKAGMASAVAEAVVMDAPTMTAAGVATEAHAVEGGATAAVAAAASTG